MISVPSSGVATATSGDATLLVITSAGGGGAGGPTCAIAGTPDSSAAPLTPANIAKRIARDRVMSDPPEDACICRMTPWFRFVANWIET